MSLTAGTGDITAWRSRRNSLNLGGLVCTALPAGCHAQKVDSAPSIEFTERGCTTSARPPPALKWNLRFPVTLSLRSVPGSLGGSPGVRKAGMEKHDE